METKLTATHEDDLEVGVAREAGAKLKQQKVRVDAPLVDFVDEDVRDSREVLIASSTEASENDTGRAEQRAATGACPTFAADCVTDEIASAGRRRRREVLAALGCDARGDADGADPARLRDDNVRGRSLAAEDCILKNESRDCERARVSESCSSGN